MRNLYKAIIHRLRKKTQGINVGDTVYVRRVDTAGKYEEDKYEPLGKITELRNRSDVGKVDNCFAKIET